MFDIGFVEIMIISLVALVVVGPERLPVVARTLGHLLGRARGYVNAIKTDIHNEMRMEELKNLHTSVNETVQSIEDSVRKEVDQIKTMTDVEDQVKAAVSPAKEDASTVINSEANASTSSVAPASQQPTSNLSEQEGNVPEKESK
ncbi:MAG: Sec-independent protein translocase protein TatB [Nitrosomonas sp.]|nr:Sec-independent protein translocase protein TatB [Nitrosomonas sp.]